MSTTNQIRRSYQNDQSVCIIACHGIITTFRVYEDYLVFME